MQCVCSGRNHYQGCGCITEGFIRYARINHFLCCIQSGNDPTQYQLRMWELGKYHAQGLYAWEGGQFSFHADQVCSCGNCGDCTPEELKYSGKPYTSKLTLQCPLHALAYEIECATRANNATSVIHPQMGRGHSNFCEAEFSVLPLYHSKNFPLSHNQLYAISHHQEWHRLQPLCQTYEQIHLPIVDGLMDIWEADMGERESI